MKFKTITKESSDESIDNIDFEKCKLSIKSPVTPKSPASDMETNNENNKENVDKNENVSSNDNNNAASQINNVNNNNIEPVNNTAIERTESVTNAEIGRKESRDFAADIVRAMENYSEDELANHTVKLEELQLRQKLMEEQNKKRKEMLAKALADR